MRGPTTLGNDFTGGDGTVSRANDGSVIFANRDFGMKTSDFEKLEAQIELFLRTCSANGFNWYIANVGQGEHTIELKALISQNVDGKGEAKVYDSTGWQVTGYISHGDLLDVGDADHHNPVTVSNPLTEDGTQGLGLTVGDGLTLSGGALAAALADGLTLDGNGNVRVAANGVTQAMLGFSTATQGELDAHVGDTTNPHNVTADQTGATSALNTHTTLNSIHHSRYTDVEAADAAPLQLPGSWSNAGLSDDTLYQNNTAELLEVVVADDNKVRLETGPTTSTSVRAGSSNSNVENAARVFVPRTHYYYVDTSGAPNASYERSWSGSL